MTAKIISGREVAEHILEKELSVKVKELKEKNIVPNLVVILVGEMKASASYVAQKEKFAAKAGIKSEVRRFTAEISEEEILTEIDKINNDSLIHGVIVQLPLPDHISVAKVLNICIIPFGVHETSVSSPKNNFPTLLGVNPSTSFEGSILLSTFVTEMWSGRGS